MIIIITILCICTVLIIMSFTPRRVGGDVEWSELVAPIYKKYSKRADAIHRAWKSEYG